MYTGPNINVSHFDKDVLNKVCTYAENLWRKGLIADL